VFPEAYEPLCSREACGLPVATMAGHMVKRLANESRERPRVMIVDDDDEMRALLRDALEREGFQVREHSTGDGLMSLLAEGDSDVVVLDKEMAGTNGLDLLRDITLHHPHTPVVLVTAFGGSEVEAEALRLGAAYYMDKPFRVARLLEVLHGVVGQAAGRIGVANDDRA
jgi:DNA-binding NtrC family response regulator